MEHPNVSKQIVLLMTNQIVQARRSNDDFCKTEYKSCGLAQA